MSPVIAANHICATGAPLWCRLSDSVTFVAEVALRAVPLSPQRVPEDTFVSPVKSDTSAAQRGASRYRRRGGDEVESSFLPPFVSLCLARLCPPPPPLLCPSVHVSEEQGEEEVRHAYTGTQTLNMSCNTHSLLARTHTHTERERETVMNVILQILNT